MSKKQILKNIQKDKKETVTKSEKDSYFKFVTTVSILLLIFILTYFLIGLFYTKEIKFNSKDDTKAEVNIDNGTIMLGQLFDKADDEYYVLVYNPSDKTSSIATWLNVYQSKESALPVYKVDSEKKFNSNYIVLDNSNPLATTLSNLRVKSPTLIKITNKNISGYIEGEDNIINVFKGN